MIFARAQVRRALVGLTTLFPDSELQ